MCFHFGECEKWISPSRAGKFLRQTLVLKSIKLDILRRANDKSPQYTSTSIPLCTSVRLGFHTTREIISQRNECTPNADLIYREWKALIKIIPSLEYCGEIAADHLSYSHHRRRFIAFEYCVIYRRYYCDTSKTCECLFK